MERDVYLPSLSHWLVYIFQAVAFCLLALIVPRWYGRYPLLLIDGAVVGAFVGQFLWSGAWCALGPGRWICRYLVVVLAGIGIAGALMAGIDLKPETQWERHMVAMAGVGGDGLTARERARNDVRQLGLALPLSLLACQLPLVWNRSYRGWRILFRQTQSQSPEAELLKFGLSDLLGLTMGAAIALGAWRLEISQISKDPSGPGAALAAAFICVFLSLIAGSLMLPVVPLVLGDRPRRLALACAAVYLSGIVTILTAVLLWSNSPARRLGIAVTTFAYLAAVASSAFIVFWVGRELGYRFVRARSRRLLKRWGMAQRAQRLLGKTNRFLVALFPRFAIACATVAGVCLLFWLVSLCTARADLGFAYRAEDEIAVARGTITISTILSTRSDRPAWVDSSKPSRWVLPGFEIEHLEDYGGRTWLTVKCSLLILGLSFAILAALFHRFRQPRRAECISQSMSTPVIG